MDQNLDTNNNLDNIVLALLFASDEPLSVRRMTSILENVGGDEINASLKRWRRRFDDEAWSITIEQVAGGYQVATRADYAPFVGRLYSKKRKLRLSRAGLETLAIIAYKQPVTRADIENIRGVGSGGVIANLMERSLIKITGKARVLGAPFLYGTTPEFLEYLGLNSLKDLPSLEELEALLEREAYPEAAVETSEPGAEDEEAAAPAAIGPEEGDELYEATAAEVAAAMAAVAEAAQAVRPATAPKPAADADAGSASTPAADPPAGAAASVGPDLEEPVNRPLGTERESASEDSDDDQGAPSAQEEDADER
jgi:segregation and condensation protein B